MPWTFAEVSFCRTILKTGILPDPQGNPTDNLQSAWTDPVWVEFLPSRFNALGKDLDLSSCTVQFVGSTVIVAEGDRSTLNLTQSVPDAHMIFVLLLTKEVPDLLGRKGQERYQGAYTIQPDVTLASWTYSGPSLNNPIGRILGIERKFNSPPPPPLINADQLWAELFPATGEAISRIVSISPPIQANNISCVVDNGGAN